MIRLIHYLLILVTSFLGANYTVAPVVPPANRVVTQIRVTVIQEGQATETTYTDSESMESILTYLRLTDATATADIDPESFRSDIYHFTVTFSDGSNTTYRQIYHEYLQKDDYPWQKISPRADLLFPTP